MCPWSSLAPANLEFCEASLCGWVTQPANTWSNVGFLVAGVAILRVARRDRRLFAGVLGAIAILTGLGSIAFHATSTFVGQAIDQSAMFLESAFFVTSAMQRWRRWPAARLLALYPFLVGASSAALVHYETIGIALFIAQIVIFAAIELRLVFRDHGTDYRPLSAAVGTFAISYGAWWLDKLGLVCAPSNHIFGLHALWHLLGALGFWFWYRYFTQFEVRAVT